MFGSDSCQTGHGNGLDPTFPAVRHKPNVERDHAIGVESLSSAISEECAIKSRDVTGVFENLRL